MQLAPNELPRESLPLVRPKRLSSAIMNPNSNFHLHYHNNSIFGHTLLQFVIGMKLHECENSLEMTSGSGPLYSAPRISQMLRTEVDRPCASVSIESHRFWHNMAYIPFSFWLLILLNRNFENSRKFGRKKT